MNSHLIFIGAPGSGKGTQSARIVSEKGFKHISTGDLLRYEIAKATALGVEVKKIMDEGGLVSDDLVIRLLQSNVSLDEHKYIFDGYPRNITQAQTLDRDVLKGARSIAVYFDIDVNKLISRLTNRRTCKSCGAIYNLITKTPKVMGVCDKCGSSELVQRADDKEDVIENRLLVFKDSVSPVIKYYQDLGRLMRVDAEESADKIYNQILSKV